MNLTVPGTQLYPEDTDYEGTMAIGEDETEPVNTPSREKCEVKRTLAELLLLSGANPQDLLLLKQGSISHLSKIAFSHGKGSTNRVDC